MSRRAIELSLSLGAITGRMRALRTMQQNGAVSDEVARALRRRIMGAALRTNPDRARYRKDNPLLDVLLRNGTLTDADVAILAPFNRQPAEAA